MKSLHCKAYFEPHDLWIGARWYPVERGVVVYVCVLPMLPIKFIVEWKS